jgi:long-chain acyl-CoA synthetase
MYPGVQAQIHPDRAAVIMASSGETLSYRVLEERSNQLAHFLVGQGLQRLDHFSMFMENHVRFIEVCAAGERIGAYYTCINSFLTAEELAYLVTNSESQILITTVSQQEVALKALSMCPQLRWCLVIGGGQGLHTNGHVQVQDYEQALHGMPSHPVERECLGTAMLYSSGTTGRPKGILRPLPDQAPAQPLPLYKFLQSLWHYRDDMVYLSPAPLYHSAPQAAVGLTIRQGGTVIIMEKFDPVHYLELIERHRVSHSQLVPTMFSRMLKLPAAQRVGHDLSSLEIAIHAAAPCPAAVKEQMIDWWGPIIHEYYGATEGLGFTACDTEQWQAHRGTVGKVLLGELRILDEEMQPCAKGVPGQIWFKTGSPFSYFNDPEKTRESSSADGSMTTVGDVGYVDDDGYLYLTDRATFMIISGGVNIYPQECENLLTTHPDVEDVAVFGVPNEEMGEEVKAVVQLMPGREKSETMANQLMAFCREHLAHVKCPKSIDFDDQLPRLPTGKLYKRLLRDKYWDQHKTRIV